MVYFRDDEELLAFMTSQVIADKHNGKGPTSDDPTYLYCYYPEARTWEERKEMASKERQSKFRRSEEESGFTNNYFHNKFENSED